MADQIPDSAKTDMADDLAALIASATDDDLSDDGRYFSESLSDLTQCRHCEIGEYQRPQDGKLVEWLWNKRHAIRDMLATRAAPPAMDREAVERVREAAYRQALEDVCNPLGYLQRMADAEGAKLSGMAYAIASDIGTIQRIAKEALSTLSADAIRQGEGEVFTGVEAWDELVNFDDRTSPEEYPDMCLITRDELIDFMERATPASHASDGGGQHDGCGLSRHAADAARGPSSGWCACILRELFSAGQCR